MFNQNDPRAWGKATASGAVKGFHDDKEAIVVRLCQRHINDGMPGGKNLPGVRGFQGVRAIRAYKKKVAHRFGLRIMAATPVVN